MANEVTITTVDYGIPEIWHPEYLKAAEANLVATSAVMRADQDVVAMGDKIHVLVGPVSTAKDKTAGADYAYEQATLTGYDITIDKHKHSTSFIEKNASLKVAYDLMEIYSHADAYAVAKQVDTDVLANTTSFSQTVGTLGQPLTDPSLLLAIRYLDDANAPFVDRRFLFAPIVIQYFRGLEKFVSVAWSGNPAASALGGGKIDTLYSIPVTMTTNVPTSGGNTQNSLIHKEAIILAIQKEPKVWTWFNGAKGGTQVTCETMYGSAAGRPTFGVLLNAE